MEQGNVSFGKQNGYGFGSALKDSLINVGGTVLTGGAIGAAGGKIASLVPYKPNAAAMDCQYADMFVKAVNNPETPSYLQGKSQDVIELTKKGKRLMQLGGKLAETDALYATVQDAAEEAIKDSEFQDSIKKVLKTKAPEGGFTKEGLLDALKTRHDKILETAEKHGGTVSKLQEEFVGKIKGLNDPEITSIAEKGAKHLRKTAVVGAGIAIGVSVALVLNLLKTYGVIGKKRPAQTTGGAQTMAAGTVGAQQQGQAPQAAPTQTTGAPVTGPAGQAAFPQNPAPAQTIAAQ